MSPVTVIVYDQKSLDDHGRMPAEAEREIIRWDDGHTYTLYWDDCLEKWVCAPDIPAPGAYWVNGKWVDDFE